MNYNSVFLFTFVANIRFLQRKDIEVSYLALRWAINQSK